LQIVSGKLSCQILAHDTASWIVIAAAFVLAGLVTRRRCPTVSRRP
jgi:hypothetical protein